MARPSVTDIARPLVTVRTGATVQTTNSLSGNFLYAGYSLVNFESDFATPTK